MISPAFSEVAHRERRRDRRAADRGQQRQQEHHVQVLARGSPTMRDRATAPRRPSSTSGSARTRFVRVIATSVAAMNATTRISRTMIADLEPVGRRHGTRTPLYRSCRAHISARSAVVLVVVAEHVQHAVDEQQAELACRIVRVVRRRHRRRDHHVAEQPHAASSILVERERQDVGRAVLVHVADVEVGHLGLVDERHGQLDRLGQPFAGQRRGVRATSGPPHRRAMRLPVRSIEDRRDGSPSSSLMAVTDARRRPRRAARRTAGTPPRCPARSCAAPRPGRPGGRTRCPRCPPGSPRRRRAPRSVRSAGRSGSTSPFTTAFEPNPSRVRNIFICSGVVFCASSRMMNAVVQRPPTHERERARPRRCRAPSAG